METSKVKYPKTFHLPFSEGLQNDDRMMSLDDYELFKTFDVVVSEKMDGESFSVYRTATHARSLDSGEHPSRSWSKAFAAQFQHEIPIGWRFVFENCYAHHSIFYDSLPTYCFLLNIWNEKNECLSWGETKYYADAYGFSFPKIYYVGKYDEKIVMEIYQGLDKTKVEGLVIRNTGRFHYDDFGKNVAKLVRKGHVQTSEHWMSKPIVKNLLQNHSI